MKHTHIHKGNNPSFSALGTSLSTLKPIDTLSTRSPVNAQGFSLLEMLIAVFIAGILMIGINGLVGTALQSESFSRSQNDTLQQARFAMQQMVRAVSGSRRLMLPLGENPATAWSESVRNVLAVTLDPTLDRDNDGWADANNDKDYLDVNNNGSRDAGEPERIDEDLPNDNNNDLAAGISGIDDNNDGSIDNSSSPTPVTDNDEDSAANNEETLDQIDNDGDGAIDEDLHRDLNRDGLPGIGGVDDDLDGLIDEGGPAAVSDDDEDGLNNEDWFDPVVFFLNGSTLMQRMPNLNPVDGTAYGEYPIAENVSQFQVSRISGGDGKTALVNIVLTLTPPAAESVTLNTRIAVGSGL